MRHNSAGVQVPFHKASVGDEEIAALAEVIRSGWLTMGSKTLEFEEEFARFVGAPVAIAVSSCTAALHLALEAIGVSPGDEVLVPTTTFTATAEVVTYVGARPVLVDVEPATLNMDPEDAERRITDRTRAIIPVHLAGQPCDMDAIQVLASKHNLRVIEDAAHALPASFQGRAIGCLSEFTAFSFYATKTLTTGEGGMITTSNHEAASRMRMMRLHGIEKDGWKRYTSEGSWHYQVLAAGFKYNFSDLQAALGLAQLKKCEAMHCARQRIAEHYTASFREIAALSPPILLGDRESSLHLYILRLNLDKLTINRNQFIEQLGKAGVMASVHFIPLHLQPFYQKTYGYLPGDFLVAEAEYVRSLSLPIYPEMRKEEVEYVISCVKRIARKCQRCSTVGERVAF